MLIVEEVDTYCLRYRCFVFFFKQKTAYEMRISDWSSDVCSSDLGPFGDGVRGLHRAFPAVTGVADHAGGATCQHDRTVSGLLESAQREQRNEMTGDRKSVV